MISPVIFARSSRSFSSPALCGVTLPARDLDGLHPPVGDLALQLAPHDLDFG